MPVTREEVFSKVAAIIAKHFEINEEDVKESMSSSRSILVRDRFDNYVFLFENEFAMRWFSEKNEHIKLYSLL